MPLLEIRILEINSFTHFSYTLWHIELKFGIWLTFDELRIKFECHQFSSNFFGVMPPLELRILEIRSFTHFSPTCFEILSWITELMVYDFFMNFRSSDLHYLWWSLKELCHLWMYSFAQFSCACFEIELKFLIWLCFLTHHSISKVLAIIAL